MLEQHLIDIGLTAKESSAYLALLRLGSQPTSVIAKKAKLNRGTAYQVLHSLLDRGLVSKTIRKRVQVFTPLNPDRLLHYLDHQASEILSKKQIAKGIISEIKALSNVRSSKPSIQFFDGTEGVRLAYEDTLTSKSKELKSYLSVYNMNEVLGIEHFFDYTQRRRAKGYSHLSIRTLEEDRRVVKQKKALTLYDSSEKEKREVRYLSDELAFPLTMYMYDEKVLLISSRKENFALIIKSKEVAEMQKKLFTHLWNSIKK